MTPKWMMVPPRGEPRFLTWIWLRWRWSLETFGPGRRTQGICRHIQKEVQEVLDNPDDRQEWLDIFLLALDGYWRHGGDPDTLWEDLKEMHARHLRRVWPKGISEDEPVEHER